ncbi:MULTISPECIES: hypothetical protein [unclassified Streptomyces]|uniref:hypothetical protein n=1 Tax=unclassified Streptomyces TaxID=2593676 RepID=UPI0023653C01|nr:MULTISPECIES: hypothetical protein [unclassified Streptomyces]MDF3141055.1 hypothetical protein [Streptomyces sp. T21Q-yed]WDF45040.1 hypothetical protein PBV52_50980 [Streptomyces sp. T12]
MTPAARHRWQTAGAVTALTVLLMALSSTPSFAADGDSGGLLDPLNVDTTEGVPVDHYELTGSDDGIIGTVLSFSMSGIFALSRTVVGFICWLIDWAYKFPVLDKLAGPAQDVSDAYQKHIIGPLGLAPLFLAWAFVFGLILIMRGRVARGVGEIMLTLLIGALAATSIVRPDMLLGYDGPIQQTQRAALEAATITANVGADDGKKNDPCDLITGPAQNACREADQDTSAEDAKKEAEERKKDCDLVAGPARDTCLTGERRLNAADVSKPITRTLTDTLVVQPYMLLEYGQNIDKDSPLYKVHKQLIDPKKPKEDPCGAIIGPAYEYCARDNGVGKAHDAFEKLGDEGKLAASTMKTATWERVIGAGLVLIAVLIVAIVILAMVLALFAAQFGCAIAAVCGVVVFAWSMLPGPNRAVLWRWGGHYASSVVVLFGIAVFIPAFGVAARFLLANNQTPLMERLLTLNGLAVTALVAHRIMLRKGHSLGHRIAERMRYARIGGSHTMDPNAAATAAAISSVNYGGPGGVGGSAAHVSFMNRHAGLASGLRALGDSTGMPGHPGNYLAEGAAEARRALAPVALGMRATHAALIGPKRPRQKITPVGPDGRPLPTLIDGRTGRVIDNSDEGVIPYGARFESALRRTRGGRMLVRTGKVAFYSTVGLPATWTRMRRAKSELTTELNQELGRQRAHYGNQSAHWRSDTRAGVRDATTPARRSYRAVADPIQRANRLRTWQQNWLDETGRPRYYGGPATDDGHVPDDVWMRRFPWEPDPADGGTGDSR